MSTSKHNLAAMNNLDLVIVGGCGHVGLPLALSLADCGYQVGINDIDQAKIEMVKAGQVPFVETGAEALLRKILPTGRLELSRDPAMLERTPVVVLVIGTPIDEFMNPSVRIFERVLDELTPHLQNGSLIILRSTVSLVPGKTVERKTISEPFCTWGVSSSRTFSKIRTDGFMNSSIGVPMTRITVRVRLSIAGSRDSSSRPVGSSLVRRGSAPASRKGTWPFLTSSILSASMSLMPTR